MQIEQRTWPQAGEWSAPARLNGAQLVLVFGGRQQLEDPALTKRLAKEYPEAVIAGCTTSGEIADTDVTDDRLTLTAATFVDTTVKGVTAHLEPGTDSYDLAVKLADSLPSEDLTHVLIFSDGTAINGSELVRGLINALPPGVTFSGGLAGDGDRFKETLVLDNTGARAGNVRLVGLYGDRVRVGFGSLGGWDPHGPTRRISRAEGNRVFSIDGRPALDLYKEVCGPDASGLPSTGLLHPLLVLGEHGEFVRTLLGIDEEEKSLIFAGDVPKGTSARFMRANFDRLVEGAEGAARDSRRPEMATTPHLALLVSCVGRRLLLKQETSRELQAVRKVLGAAAVMTGFYSYGEICPVARDANCSLHNQTMTITTLYEDDGASR